MNVSNEVLAQAMEIESTIIDLKRRNDRTFVEVAYLLDVAESHQLYLARGFPTFRSWVSSPELNFGGRLAHDLLRIRRELVPLLTAQLGDERDAIEAIAQAGISRARLLLPLLKFEGGEVAIETLMELAPTVTYEDMKSEVKALTHPDLDQLNERYPTMFRARAEQGATHTRVAITGSDGVRVADCGTLTVPNEFMARLLNTNIGLMLQEVS